MSIVKWSNSLLIGNEMIDNEHKMLVDLVNNLHTAILEDKADEVINSVLSSLHGYTKDHFSDEEKLMTSINYPDLN